MCMSYFAYLKQGEVIFIETFLVEVPEVSGSKQTKIGKWTKKSAVPEISNKGKYAQVFFGNLCEHVCVLYS